MAISANKIVKYIKTMAAKAFVAKRKITEKKKKINKFETDFHFVRVNNSRRFKLGKSYRDDHGEHPENYVNYECAFVSNCLYKIKPSNILDVASYRVFVQGMLSGYRVTSLDVRKRSTYISHEKVITADITEPYQEEEMYDVCISMCAIEHFGLGRYGDRIDLDADRKSIDYMKRALKPGGSLIFTTTVARRAWLHFNAHRVYDYDMISDLVDGLNLVDESFYSRKSNKVCNFQEITQGDRGSGDFDVYCCWRIKPNE